MIRRLRKLGGNVRWSPHTFRNTFAINHLRAGGDPFTLQILGGWEDLEMPMHYSAALKTEDAFKVHRRVSPANSMELKCSGHKIKKLVDKDLSKGIEVATVAADKGYDDGENHYYLNQ